MTRSHGTASLKRKATDIDRILTKVYGRKDAELEDDPLDTLVETILSQNTTDKNSHRAFQALKKAYPSWCSLMGEDADKVAKVIRSGGLAGIKASRILGALQFINRERGVLDIDFLRDMSPQDAEAWLAQMKGVGPKTRSIVLLFSLGMPAFPVDTHIHRVTKRIGLIGPRVSREQAQTDLAALVPRREFFNYHINLIEHGRTVCQARKPRCSMCQISRYCDYFVSTTKAES
ncbi:MAG: endonuclease III [Euryarchaeota archaeon]|nr:endonuclease III [Euryarchaeota archaeon]